jgi:hypothetical protein
MTEYETSQNRIEKPGKLIAALIFLYFSYFLHVLNRAIDLNNIPEIKHYYIANVMLVGLIVVIWITYLIINGKNWARYFLLIYCILLIPRLINDLFNYITFEPVTYAHQCVQLVFVLSGFSLLFSKDSSKWFKKVKLKKTKTHIVSWNYKISSICLYCSYSLGLSSIIILFSSRQAFDDYYSYLSYNYISFIFENIVVALALNVLFIQTIRNGSKLAGIIYFSLFILAAYAKRYFLILGFVANPFFFPWIMRIILQIVAFVILFHKDIVTLFVTIGTKVQSKK